MRQTSATRLLLSLYLSTIGARVAVAPKPLDTWARDKPDVKNAVRVGGDRFRGNAVEAAGFIAGGALVFAGGRLPTSAMVPLFAWGIVASLSARSCEGVINATTQDEPRKAKLREQLPGLAAVVGVHAAQQAAGSDARLSHRMIASGLLGGYLLVECSLSHLRREVDQLVLRALVALRPLLGGFLPQEAPAPARDRPRPHALLRSCSCTARDRPPLEDEAQARRRGLGKLGKLGAVLRPLARRALALRRRLLPLPALAALPCQQARRARSLTSTPCRQLYGSCVRVYRSSLSL